MSRKLIDLKFKVSRRHNIIKKIEASNSVLFAKQNLSQSGDVISQFKPIRALIKWFGRFKISKKYWHHLVELNFLSKKSLASLLNFNERVFFLF